MECNCNNNNNGGVIPWVRGNRLPLCICIYQMNVDQGTVSTMAYNTMTRTPYAIQADDTVTVTMKSGFRSVEMPFTTDGNKVLVIDNGELPTGTYTVEVTIERGSGERGRWQESRQVRIYENTDEAILGEMYSIEADLFFWAKGDTGNGIANITSNPDDTLTITMTDGTTYTTQAMKGDKGDKGDQGEKGTSIVSFDVTGQTDTSVIYTVTFSDDTTEEVAVPKGPQGDTGLTGNGISSTTLNRDYTLTIAYTDGTTYTTSSIRGAQGVQGVSIIAFTQTGETSTNTLYNVVFSDGRTQSVAIPKGLKGDKGDTGNTGPQGIQGPKGDTVTATDYTLYNVQGSDSQGAMSQDATTKAISAQTGYYTCGAAADKVDKVAAVENGNLYKRTLGGHFKVKMTNANTASGVTLQIGSETATTLWYNGAAASADNSWDAGEVLSVYYDGTYYQASNAQGGGGKAEKIKYDNSQSELAAENVQVAVDEIGDCIYSYEIVDWVSQTTSLGYFINGTTGAWSKQSSSYNYYCRILPINSNTNYRITASDSYPAHIALLTNNNPQDHEGDTATDWNDGKAKRINAGKSLVVNSGEYTYLYFRNNVNSTSSDFKNPKRIEIRKSVNEAIEALSEVTDALGVDIEENEKHILDVESRLYPYLDNISEVNYSFSTNVFGTNTSYQHAAIPVSVGEEYIIEAPSDVNAFYCFATSNVATSGNAIPFIDGVTSATGIGKGNKVKVVIPDSCTYLLVYNVSNTRPFLVKKESLLKKVRVTLGYDYIMASGNTAGDFGQHQQYFESGQYLSTPRFIKISEAFICKFSHAGRLRVIYYDSEFNFVGFKNYPANDSPAIEANTDIFVNEARFKYSYVKLLFDTETPFNNGKPLEVEAEVRGNLDDNWDVFNIRTATYHRICVMVNVSDARCSDGITSQIQDSIDLRPNYGVIALPKIYSNTGKPTRLIIYCHGSGTHFTFSNSTGFNTSEHVDTKYWRKEGYAVMDIDGNPMSDSAHTFRPQAMSAYIAAYKWAIEHYNLCRDGVLLGGRSMGGGTVMYLLRGTCPIPVIAACANHPTSVAMNETASAKLSIANMRGFIIPDGFTFSDGPMTDEETQVYYDNWDKSLRYVPSLALCVDTPTTEEWRKNFIKNCCHVGNPYEANRIASCKDLHMVVRAPLKMFACTRDPNNGYQATSQLYMTMLGNAGQQAELRLFDSNKANYEDGRNEHFYELADPNLRTTFTTVYGEEVTDVPVVYIEMLQFWRRYEQNM